MFRILKIGSFITQSACHNRNFSHRQDWRLITTHRYYSKKKDECPPCPKEQCKTPKPITPECKPETINPCKPKPVDSGFGGEKPLPLYHDCPTTNRMDTMPKLQCPHHVHDGRQKRKYLYVLILGTIVFLISAATLYKVLNPPPVVEEKTVKVNKKKKVIVKMPLKSCDIPSSVPYLLIGGGTAAFSAFRAIKSSQPDAKVLVISSESDFPYMRPPLSKELWFSPDESVKDLMFKQWNGSERSLFYEPEDFYVGCKELNDQPNGGVAVAKGWNVTQIDVVERKAILEDGYEISYDKCLIATGAIPKSLDIFDKAEDDIKENVSLYHEIYNFQRIHEVIQTAESIAIVGGGFLGSELACALARKGNKKLKVTQIFREAGNMGKVLPEYLSHWTTEKVKCEGVNVIPHAEVVGVSLNQQKKIEINLSNDKKVIADHVIVSIGVTPNTLLAEKSMLEVDPDLGGYLVNTELQARSHLYIAGDCSCFYDTKLGRRRVEHHDHAVVSGRLAGENMAGASKPYWHQSMFWSDLGPDVGYEAIGIVDSALPTVGVFAKATSADSPKGVVTQTDEGIRSKTEEEIVPPECDKYIKADPEQKKLAEKLRKEQSNTGEGEDFGKGIVFYLRDDIVVGIVLWNVFNRMNIARQVLKDERKYDDLNEVAKLFNIHDE